MIRKAFVMQLHPDMETEYQNRHTPIPIELEKVLKNHGVHNYSIFSHPQNLQLFAYVEIEDEEKWQAIAQTGACKKWWGFMADVMETNPDHSPVSLPFFGEITLSLIDMKIVLMGSSTASFTKALEEAGIEYDLRIPKPQSGLVFNVAGDVVQLVGDAVPWASLATVAVAWLKMRASRKIIVTTKDNEVVHTEGLSVAQFEQVLAIARETTVIDTEKAEISK